MILVYRLMGFPTPAWNSPTHKPAFPTLCAGCIIHKKEVSDAGDFLLWKIIFNRSLCLAFIGKYQLIPLLTILLAGRLNFCVRRLKTLLRWINVFAGWLHPAKLLCWWRRSDDGYFGKNHDSLHFMPPAWLLANIQTPMALHHDEQKFCNATGLMLCQYGKVFPLDEIFRITLLAKLPLQRRAQPVSLWLVLFSTVGSQRLGNDQL